MTTSKAILLLCSALALVPGCIPAADPGEGSDIRLMPDCPHPEDCEGHRPRDPEPRDPDSPPPPPSRPPPDRPPPSSPPDAGTLPANPDSGSDPGMPPGPDPGTPPAPDPGTPPSPDPGTPPAPDPGAPPDPDPGAPPSDAGPSPGLPPDPGGALPGDALVFIDYPATRSETGRTWGSVLTDIAQHLPPSYGSMYWDSDLITAGHETTHGINSDVRNYHAGSVRDANGFYVLEGRGVIVADPDIRKSDANRFVPSVLHASRWDLYMAGSESWDDTPTYIFDEWVAYTNGGAVGVDLVNAGLWTYGWRDGVAGQLEFTIYAIAVAMAVESGDPTYWSSADGDQFREFVAWNARRAMRIFREGAVMTDFQYDEYDTYYENMRTHRDAAPIRDFVRRVWGDALVREIFDI